MNHKSVFIEPKSDKTYCAKEGKSKYDAQKRGKVNPRFVNTYLTEEIGYDN